MTSSVTSTPAPLRRRAIRSDWESKKAVSAPRQPRVKAEQRRDAKKTAQEDWRVVGCLAVWRSIKHSASARGKERAQIGALGHERSDRKGVANAAQRKMLGPKMRGPNTRTEGRKDAHMNVSLSAECCRLLRHSTPQASLTKRIRWRRSNKTVNERLDKTKKKKYCIGKKNDRTSPTGSNTKVINQRLLSSQGLLKVRASGVLVA